MSNRPIETGPQRSIRQFLLDNAPLLEIEALFVALITFALTQKSLYSYVAVSILSAVVIWVAGAIITDEDEDDASGIKTFKQMFFAGLVFFIMSFIISNVFIFLFIILCAASFSACYLLHRWLWRFLHREVSKPLANVISVVLAVVFLVLSALEVNQVMVAGVRHLPFVRRSFEQFNCESHIFDSPSPDLISGLRLPNARVPSTATPIPTRSAD